jgi:hypothetical protein
MYQTAHGPCLSQSLKWSCSLANFGKINGNSMEFEVSQWFLKGTPMIFQWN